MTFHLWPHQLELHSDRFKHQPEFRVYPPSDQTRLCVCFVFVSDLETYLPQERQSVAFKVSRFGLKRDEPLQRLGRFDSLCLGRVFLIDFIWKLHVACSLLVCDRPGSRQPLLTRNVGTCSCLQVDPSGPWSGVLRPTQPRRPSTSLWPAIEGWMTSTL